MRPHALTLLAALVWLGLAPAYAQPPSRDSAKPEAPAATSTGQRGKQGAVTQRAPLPPGTRTAPPGARGGATRGPRRLFVRCNREARARKLRGARRRAFVARCRLGYGPRLRASLPAVVGRLG